MRAALKTTTSRSTQVIANVADQIVASETPTELAIPTKETKKRSQTKLALAESVFDAGGGRAQFEKMMDQVLTSVVALLAEQDPVDVPRMSAAFKPLLEAALDFDGLRKTRAQMASVRYTAEELKGLLAYVRDPTTAKLKAATPQIFIASMQWGNARLTAALEGQPLQAIERLQTPAFEVARRLVAASYTEEGHAGAIAQKLANVRLDSQQRAAVKTAFGYEDVLNYQASLYAQDFALNELEKLVHNLDSPLMKKMIAVEARSKPSSRRKDSEGSTR